MNAIWIGLFLASCSPTGRSPTLYIYGAYFPSWIACSLIGVVGAVVVRLILIKTGIDTMLVWRSGIYLCIAIGIGFAASLMLFGR